MFKLPHTVFKVLRSNRPLSVVKYDSRKCLKSTTAEVTKPQGMYESDIVEEIGSRNKGPIAKTQHNNRMVAAAFAALGTNTETIRTPFTDDKISKAQNISELLSISEGSGVSRRHALKVVSTLADWSSSGKVKLSDFENDARFIKLCRILTKAPKINRNLPQNDDLSTVLNVTADEEAARLVASLTLAQAVKVITTLSQKKRRSVSLLRSLSYNITSSTERLNLKESADLLYSLCILNYHDDNLLDKIITDISAELGNVLKTSSVIGSIITSLGLLKYKNCEILDELSEWIVHNRAICRQQDMFSLFITLATLNHTPAISETLYKILLPQLTQKEMRKPTDWLNMVWALVILNQATVEHVSSVLTHDFISGIEKNTSAKLKLLNINAYAECLLQNYQGPTLAPTSDIYHVTLGRTKEKLEMTSQMLDALKNLIQAEDCLRTNVNTQFGFFIDAYCVLDQKCRPLPIGADNEGYNQVAILVFGYHDMCHGGKVEPTGPNALALRLLESRNYKIVTVPYTKFKMMDTLVHRVQFLESQLKQVVN